MYPPGRKGGGKVFGRGEGATDAVKLLMSLDSSTRRTRIPSEAPIPDISITGFTLMVIWVGATEPERLTGMVLERAERVGEVGVEPDERFGGRGVASRAALSARDTFLGLGVCSCMEAAALSARDTFWGLGVCSCTDEAALNARDDFLGLGVRSCTEEAALGDETEEGAEDQEGV